MPFDLYLHHGRKTIDESLDDWGPNGPTLHNVIGIHQTYGAGPNVYFTDKPSADKAHALTAWEEWDDNALTMKWQDGLVVVTQESTTMLYGDWGLIAPSA
jgi:hypothetical protein